MRAWFGCIPARTFKGVLEQGLRELRPQVRAVLMLLGHGSWRVEDRDGTAAGRVERWGAAILLALLCAAPARAACRPDVLAVARLRMQDGFALVTAEVGGRPATFLLDTGAQGMLLLPDAVSRLELPVEPGQTARLLGTGGPRDAPIVKLRGLTLAGVAVPGGSVPVAALPGVPVTDPPLAGLIGAPLLLAYDVELDLRAGRLTLLAPTGCAPPGVATALQDAGGSERLLPVRVNGAALLAIPDTGTRITLLSNAAAGRLGLDAPVSASTARGIDGQRVTLRHLRLRTLQAGAEVTAAMPVSITELQIAPADMLLGLDWFSQRRVWLSYAAGLMVVRPKP